VSAAPDGTALLVGHFAGTITFGEGEAGEVTFTSDFNDGWHPFVARYAPDGAPVWIKKWSSCCAIGIAALADGGAVVLGAFVAEALLGEGEPNETKLTTESLDLFLARFAADGALLWARTLGVAGVEARAIAATGEGAAIYVAGSAGSWEVAGDPHDVAGVWGPATFSAGTASETLLAPVGKKDGFVARYDAEGTLEWVMRLGGVDQDETTGIAIGQGGGVLAAGILSGPFKAGFVSPADVTRDYCSHITPCGHFVALLTDAGEVEWLRRMETEECGHSAVAAMPDGGAVLVGQFTGQTVLGPGEPSETVLTPAGEGTSDAFIAKFGP
jgi:hypothetical protein